MNTCCPDVEGHALWCGHAPLDITKEGFVAGTEGGVRAGIASYLIGINQLGMTHDEALEIALDETAESAACFAGVGSCYSGGCKH